MMMLLVSMWSACRPSEPDWSATEVPTGVPTEVVRVPAPAAPPIDPDLPKRTVEVALGDPEVGAMDADDRVVVHDLIQRKLGHVKYCYERRLLENPELAGQVKVAWTMGAGAVSAVRVNENSTGDEALASCVVGKVERWTFPRGVTADVVWPFVFATTTP